MNNTTDKEELMGAIRQTQEMVTASKQEIFEAIHAFAEQVDGRFDRLETDVDFLKSDVNILKVDVGVLKADVGGLKNDVGILKTDFGSLKTDVGSLKNDTSSLKAKVTSIESRMVDKAYLDDKIADLRGDLIALSRKEDVKLSTLVEELVVQGSLSRRTADRILALEPFARSS